MLLTAEDIERLISGCKKNDRKAQEQLYRAFHGSMSMICMRYTKHQQDASVVLNNGFLKVFLKINQYDASRSAFGTWMQKIMVNTAIDFLREKSRFHPADLAAIKVEAAIESDVILKMNADALLALIREMPASTQLVFNLFTIDGFNHREIGEMLGISEGTSRWHLNQARNQLKQSLMIPQK
ncbi:MAG: sigma-70 family RNA polymerase sigma factor [Puia sp.]